MNRKSHSSVLIIMHNLTHTQPFNGTLCGTNRVGRYQRKHSPAHIHEEAEEEGFTQTTRSALSQQGLSEPIKPAYNQSRPDVRLELTASAYSRLWITMLAAVMDKLRQIINNFNPHLPLKKIMVKCKQSI